MVSMSGMSPARHMMVKSGAVFPKLQDRDTGAFIRAARILKVLGHPERLKIVNMLEREVMTASAIQDGLQLPQSTVSGHLALMRNHGIVTTHRRGRNVLYKLTDLVAMSVIDACRQWVSELG
jgi:ArsR family transcriptional regulator